MSHKIKHGRVFESKKLKRHLFWPYHTLFWMAWHILKGLVALFGFHSGMNFFYNYVTCRQGRSKMGRIGEISLTGWCKSGSQTTANRNTHNCVYFLNFQPGWHISEWSPRDRRIFFGNIPDFLRALGFLRKSQGFKDTVI